jgi:hypothetical protein
MSDRFYWPQREQQSREEILVVLRKIRNRITRFKDWSGKDGLTREECFTKASTLLQRIYADLVDIVGEKQQR